MAEEIKAETAEPAAPAFIAEQEPETITAPFTSEPAEAVVSQDYAFEAAPITETFDTDFTEQASAGYKTGPLETPETIEDASSVTEAASGSFFTAPEMHADEPRKAFAAPAYERADDGGYYVTVIPETNTKQRNTLLLGAAGFVLLFVATVTLVSLFSKDFNIASIDDSPLFSAVLMEEFPMPVEDVEPEKVADDDDGGGGGGGKNEQTPASRGDLPDMAKNPSRPPDVNTPRLENPSLVLPLPQIQGPPMRTPKEYGKWGVPNGLDGPPSNGPGSGGGIGSGNGTGVGSGNGTGAGSGNGSGLGGGNGDGIGNGTGVGGAPPVLKPVTENYRILSKPKPPYTDAARTNQVQGRVLLKITLLASGQVGNITPIQRLPHGLTENAIAAARQIKFTPKKVNGVAQSVIVTIDYGFNIY